MVKLVRVCQMMMQYVQYKSEQQFTAQQMAEEDQNELQVRMLVWDSGGGWGGVIEGIRPSVVRPGTMPPATLLGSLPLQAHSNLMSDPPDNSCHSLPQPLLILQAHISLMPNMELGGLAQGLQKLERDYRGVADADMDAMFQQVGGGAGR